MIDASDQSALQSVVYSGRGERQFWNDVDKEWSMIATDLLDVQYPGRQVEFQVHPELGSREAARSVVGIHSSELGRLPAVLMSRANEVEIGPTSGAAANSSLGIHHIAVGDGARDIENGFWQEVLVHEGAHVSLDIVHASSSGWRSAQVSDGTFISTYARDFREGEDVAETFLMWFAVRYQAA